jgi:hypothetical protein
LKKNWPLVNLVEIELSAIGFKCSYLDEEELQKEAAAGKDLLTKTRAVEGIMKNVV